MRKTTDLLPEYDFSAGVRGKYAARVAKGSNIVVLRALAEGVAAAHRGSRSKAARKRAT